MKQHSFLMSLLLAALLGLAGCRVSLSPGNVSLEYETFSVAQFQNTSQFVVPNQAQQLTIAVQDRLAGQTRLRLREGNAHLNFSGTITGFTVAPQGATQPGQPAQQKLSVAVNVRCDNQLYPDQSWEQVFTAEVPFDANVSLASVQDALLEIIHQNLTQEIFSKAFGQW